MNYGDNYIGYRVVKERTRTAGMVIEVYFYDGDTILKRDWEENRLTNTWEAMWRNQEVHMVMHPLITLEVPETPQPQ